MFQALLLFFLDSEDVSVKSQRALVSWNRLVDRQFTSPIVFSAVDIVSCALKD